MRDVSIIGTGITKFGELWDKSLRQLGLETGLAAISDAGITSKDIDALYIGNMAAGSTLQQEHVSALMADYCGLTNNHVPATRVEAASASGGLALRQAYMAIAGGFIDIAVVGGAEKMTDVSDSESSYRPGQNDNHTGYVRTIDTTDPAKPFLVSEWKLPGKGVKALRFHHLRWRI